MTAARCDLTELLADQCAHCTGATLDVDDRPAIDPAYRWPARFAGVCGVCSDAINPGDTIGALVDHPGYAHEGCGR